MITELVVRGMQAPGCAYNAKIALEMIEGVEEADVNFHSQAARVSHSANVNDDELIRQLQRFGFTVELAS